MGIFLSSIFYYLVLSKELVVFNLLFNLSIGFSISMTVLLIYGSSMCLLFISQCSFLLFPISSFMSIIIQHIFILSILCFYYLKCLVVNQYALFSGIAHGLSACYMEKKLSKGLCIHSEARIHGFES